TADGDTAVGRLALTELARDEEAEPVLDDRAAEREGEAALAEVADLVGQSAIRQLEAADHALVTAVVAERAVELVRPRLGDGVDAGTGEAALADVEGRDDDDKLLDRLHGDRLGADVVTRRAAGAQTE